ncbi:MAG: AAA domain-containing protein [Lachnospiraceae bacterium]
MNSVCRDIFKAIHEGKWLKIEYKNKEERVTKYWIGILDLDVYRRTLKVEGLHLGKYTLEQYDFIKIDAILSSQIVEGSYCTVNKKLINDIAFNPHKYKSLFDNVANLKILNYLEMCNRLDTIPYKSDFELIHYIDRDSFCENAYRLSDEQFKSIVSSFQYKMERGQAKSGKLSIQQLAMNVLSIHTDKGLYVLAYKKLQLDVKNRVMRADDNVTICTEYTIDGTKESIRKFLDADEYELLTDFEKNQERIKDCISAHHQQVAGVDDMPYVIGIGMDIILDLHEEYRAIIDMYQSGEVTVPIKAFFGDLLERPRRNKAWPITLANSNINMDQLLAINNAMKYPVAYIQGPPGTGKTNTIINTIVTAYFNDRTVLFSSYNNHPINGVFEKLTNLEYQGKKIPFPVLRLGNAEKVKEAIVYIKNLYEQVKHIKIFDETLDKRKDNRIERAKQLSDLLKRYEDVLDLKERKDTLNRMMEYQDIYAKKQGQTANLMPFSVDLQGRQLQNITKKIEQSGEVSEEEAKKLLNDNQTEFYQYLYYTSARLIKKLSDKRYSELWMILNEENEEKQLAAFNEYLGKTENIKKLQKVFPVIITTCISAHKIGEPTPMFDMVIIDEASQCNTAVSLVPIIRGDNLMLVGDPQQLNPVILLDEIVNHKLRKKYGISDEYDYRKNSIYKTFLACDSVSDEVLLHNHYRCNSRIIGFNNKKYYNSRLNICTNSKEEKPLVYVNVQNNSSGMKNTAPAEVDEIIRYAKLNKDKSIGVITPFVNQKRLIEEAIQKEQLQNVVCGTVHAFQGDEKDVVLFSTAITDRTQAGTYEWLKNNKELINVATSRARDKLIVLSDTKNLERLHNKQEDDLYELIDYVRTNGVSQVTPKHANSRALGVKPFSTATEEAFLENLNHALENIWLSQSKYTVQKEVAISQVFQNNENCSDLFYTGRFDFVVYEKQGRTQIPILAIELDGKEHFTDEAVKFRDSKKNAICKAHNLQLIRVENSYARRYNHIKEILLNYFSIIH